MSSCGSECSCPIVGLSRCGDIQAGLVVAVVFAVVFIVGSAVGICLCCRKKMAAKQHEPDYGEVAQSKDMFPVKQEELGAE